MYSSLKNLAIIAVAALAISGCSSKKEVSTSAYQPQPTQSVGYNADGTRTLVVTERGRDRKEAVENARRKAVYEVTFYGVQGTTANTSAYPIIDSPTVREQHPKYFDKFFGNGGRYEKYAKVEGSAKELQGDGFVTVTVTVKVNTIKLRKQFVDDNIIE